MKRLTIMMGVLLYLSWITGEVHAAVPTITTTRGQPVKGCHPSYFECSNGMCVKAELRCNHVDNCGDNSDEINCTVKSAPTSCPADSYLCKDPPMCVTIDDLCSDFNGCTDYDVIDSICPVKCQPHKMKCLNASQCVDKKYVCDGNKDCIDGSDELHCDDEKYKCKEPDSFLCDDQSDCIFAVDVCDGHKMCDDGSDEKNDCENLCKAKKCGSNQHCLPAGRGVKCVCKDGYKFDKTGNCIEINYCNTSDVDRPCSQTCIEGRFGRGPQCRCLYGYTLDKDGSSCNAQGSEAILYVATANAIQQWSVKTQRHSTLIDGLQGVRGLAVDTLGRRIFWSEMGDGGGHPEVYSMNIEEGERSKSIITSFGLQKPEGLAYDFITKNLYIVDSGIPAILACELQQKRCVTVFNSSVVRSPKDIVVNPAEGLLYYTETGSEPALMRGSMDGKSFDALVSVNIHHPTSLHLDLTTNRLYWIDSLYFSGQIYKVDLDGSNKKPVMTHKISSAKLMAIFEDSIFWVSDKNDVITTNKFTANRARSLFQIGHHPTALVIEQTSLQNDLVINRCHSKRCHLCLLSDQGSGSCFCSIGYQVAFSEQYCERIESHSFLLASDKDQIVKIPLNTTGRPTPVYLKTSHMRGVNSLAYLPKSHSVLYSNLDLNHDGAVLASIGRMRRIDQATPLSDKVVSGVSSVINIAADETSSIVFWTDHTRRSIRVASIDGQYNATLPINASLPNALCVNAAQGILFFSEKETGSSKAFIKQCRLDGQLCTRLVSDRVQFPNHLVSYGQKLFWSDYDLGEISSIDRWGRSRTTIAITDGSPLSFAMDSGILYWIEDGKSSIFYKHIHKEGGYEGHIDTDANSLEDLIAVVPHTLPQSACTHGNGGCEQICIPIERSVEVSCMCSEGFHLHDDKRQCVKDLPNCDGHFCPGENVCLDESKICDGRFDCRDWSDENGCLRQETCSLEEFKCENGRCISEHFVCDNDDDCNDGSDELSALCPNKCSSEEHECDSGKCVPSTYVCDGEADCQDKSDEANCETEECDEDEFSCGFNHCISKAWVCDSEKDCDDGRDEFNCTLEACKDGEFTCHDGSCIDELEVCDNWEQCDGGEDEAGCAPLEKCSDNEYTCADGECIHKSAKCDGLNDCSNNEDEAACDDLCGEQEFQCENDQCIPFHLICNAKADCRDGSDEFRSCPPPVTEPSSELSQTGCQGFTCGNGRCIEAGKRCDGTPDCVDNADEVNCQFSCKNFNKCAQICSDTQSGPKCSCAPGYQLKSDGLACEDIDECKFQNGGCSQRCINVKGHSSTLGLGFKCQCFDKFERGPNYYSCKVRGSQPELLVGTPSGIKIISVEGQHKHESIIKATKDYGVWKVQVDAQRKTIFWTGNFKIYALELGKQPQIIFNGHIFEFALDWITGNIYVVHSSASTQISVLKKIDNDDNIDTSVLKQVVFTPSSWMRGLALHPQKGCMFYLSFDSSITVATMDGKRESEMTLASRHAHQVSALNIDVVTDRLYWVNRQFGQLMSVTTDDQDFCTYDLYTNMHRIYNFDIFNSVAYFKRNNSVLSYTLHKEINPGIKLVASLNWPLSVQVYHALTQPESPNPCEKRECMYMCLLSDHGWASCICPEGLTTVENPSCEGPSVQVDEIFKQLAESKSTEVTTDSPHAEQRTQKQRTGEKTLKIAPKEPKEHEEETPKQNTFVFKSECALLCLNGGSCVLDKGRQSCKCSDGFEGSRCERRNKDQEKITGEEEEESFAWVAGLVVGLALLVFLVVLAVWYFKYKRHSRSPSSIRFKKQNKFVVCNQDDKDGLVPEISFGNPGFQEEIDEEAHMQEEQDWWKKLLSRSRRSVDSAFHSKTSMVGEEGLDDRCMRGDPQDTAMSDKVRLLK